MSYVKAPANDVLERFVVTRGQVTVLDVATHFGMSYRNSWTRLKALTGRGRLRRHACGYGPDIYTATNHDETEKVINQIENVR